MPGLTTINRDNQMMKFDDLCKHPVTILGPVGFDPTTNGIAGMNWFIHYLSTHTLEKQLLWYAEDKFPTRSAAVQKRNYMLANIPNCVPIDDQTTFLAQLVRQAKLFGY